MKHCMNRALGKEVGIDDKIEIIFHLSQLAVRNAL